MFIFYCHSFFNKPFVKDSEDEDYQTVVALPPSKRVKLQQPEIKEEADKAENENDDSETDSETDYSTDSETDSDTL